MSIFIYFRKLMKSEIQLVEFYYFQLDTVTVVYFSTYSSVGSGTPLNDLVALVG